MEILTFYSYKGGTGRTTALANVAACLHRLGRRVVVIDLDVDAPGAADKFGKREEVNAKVKKEGGIIEFLINLYDYRHKDRKDVPATAIDKLAVKICAPIEGRGGIYLLPTFDFLKHPFSLFESYRWQFLVSRDDEEGRNFQYFLLLRDLIEKRLKPDYLLVDLTAGITSLGTAVMIAWSKSVINFTGTNVDDLWATKVLVGENLRNTVQSSRARLRSGRPARLPRSLPEEFTLRFLPVLSRIALFSDRAGIDKLVKEAQNEYFRDTRTWDSPLCIHSDPQVERQFFLRIPLSEEEDHPMENAQLTRDYLDLVAYTCPREIPGHGKESPREYLLEQLGIPKRELGRHRFFQIHDAQGVMVNLEDDARNVAFKVETFTAMLGDIHAGMLAEYQKLEPWMPKSATSLARQAVESSFLESGVRAGRVFGKSLCDVLWKGKELSDKERIAEWCEFDSDVGFGRMKPEIKARDGRVTAGEIHIIENFLAAGRKASDPNLCWLMQGYIQGVLTQILDDPAVEVSHDLASMCMAVDSGRKECVFSFARREQIS